MRVRITYEIITQESASLGDIAERGWENEEGIDFSDFDEPIQEVVEFLQDQGAIFASDYDFRQGVWYSTEAKNPL